MNFDGKRLKLKRKENGLSLDALAKLCKTSKSYVWELENNKDLEPSGHKIFLLSQSLNTPMEFFYGVDEDTTKKVLGTLITWLGQSGNSTIGIDGASDLLKMLNPNTEVKNETQE